MIQQVPEEWDDVSGIGSEGQGKLCSTYIVCIPSAQSLALGLIFPCVSEKCFKIIT